MKSTSNTKNDKQRTTKVSKEAPGNGRESQYNTKIWKTDGGERDLYQPFVEYVGHRPQADKVLGIFFLTPVDGPTTNVWYKAVSVDRNTLAKQVKTIAYIASLDGKFTNSSGCKTVIQSLREDFHPLEISELTSHANPYSIGTLRYPDFHARVRLAPF